jgi:hypothetical protein
MTAISSGDRLWAEFRALAPESRAEFLMHLVRDNATRAELEDLLDLDIAERRSNEPTRPLTDVLNDLET